jgi:hypothetical protein
VEEAFDICANSAVHVGVQQHCGICCHAISRIRLQGRNVDCVVFVWCESYLPRVLHQVLCRQLLQAKENIKNSFFKGRRRKKRVFFIRVDFSESEETEDLPEPTPCWAAHESEEISILLTPHRRSAEEENEKEAAAEEEADDREANLEDEAKTRRFEEKTSREWQFEETH